MFIQIRECLNGFSVAFQTELDDEPFTWYEVFGTKKALLKELDELLADDPDKATVTEFKKREK